MVLNNSKQSKSLGNWERLLKENSKFSKNSLLLEYQAIIIFAVKKRECVVDWVFIKIL